MESVKRPRIEVEERLILFDKNEHGMQMYDPNTNEVRKFHEATTKFTKSDDFVAVSLDSHLYILCETVHRLNLKDNNSKWERLPDMITRHGVWPPTIPLSGSLFVIGSSGVEPICDMERFEPRNSKWVKLDDRPEAVGDAALVSVDETIYSIGGWHNDKETNALSSYTPSTSTWTALEPMKNTRHYCGAVAVAKKIFVVAGCDESVATNNVECYDVKSAQWSTLSPTLHRHEFNRAFHLDGWIYTVSRYENAKEIEKYDIANDKWHKVDMKDGVFEVTESVIL